MQLKDPLPLKKISEWDQTVTMETKNELSADSTEFVHIDINEGFFYLFFKRTFDIFSSLIALILLLPVFLATTVAIYIEDGTPAFFSQWRCGKDGKVFKMYKFRSMCHGADNMLDALKEKNQKDGPIFKISNDPRITKVGNFVRRFSIDEIPQFFNVLKGDMSIVGPRPPLIKEVKEYSSYQMHRLDVKPGLTCYWQISGRSNLSFDEWVRLDLLYISERSLLKDLKIMIKTIPAVLSTKGAY